MLLTRDLRDAIRLLATAPHLSLGITLSVGIAFALMLTVINIASATAFRSIPGTADADRLVRVYLSRDGGGEFLVPYPVYEYFGEHASVFSDLAAQTAEPETTSWSGGTSAAGRVEVTLASGRSFTTLGVTPVLGRFFTDDDFASGSGAVAVVSYRLWQREFGQRADALGAVVRLNGQPLTIVGVAPSDFIGLQLGVESDVWAPLTMAEAITGRSDWLDNADGAGLAVIGRLAPATSRRQAQAELQVLAKQFDARFPTPDGARGAVVRSAVGIGPPLEVPLLAFLAALLIVGLVALVVAASNSVTLLLIRAEARRAETAVRLALGARRADIIRRELCETCVLALAAGIGACLLMMVSGRFLTAWLPTELPVAIDFSPDWRVFAAALGGSLLLGLALGAAPALRGTRTDVARAIVKAGNLNTSPTRSRARHVLIFLQASAAMALLVCASVLSRSIDSVTRIDLGFPASGLHVVHISRGIIREPERRRQFVQRLEERTANAIGLSAATTAWFAPFSQSSDKIMVRQPENGQLVMSDYNIVGTPYFDAMGIEIVRGRGFTSGDNGVVINEYLAARIFPGVDPIGRNLLLEPARGTADYVPLGVRPVVGVARQAKYRAPWESALPFFYLPFSSAPPPSVALLVRTGPGPSERILDDLARDIRTLDADVTAVTTESFEQSFHDVFLWTRITRVFFSIAALTALSVAAIGVYATVSYTIRQRTREIAIRVAIGATRRTLIEWVVRQGGLVIAGGGVLGAMIASVIALALSTMPIISVQADDPVPYVAAVGVFAVAIVVAMYLALRKMDVRSPWRALRPE
jgi:predicted permease